MGLAASQARMLMITARTADLELQGQFINQGRTQLANITGTLFTISANLDPESPQMQALQARIAAIASIDKALEQQLKRIETQRQALTTERDSVKKVMDDNIAATFKAFQA